MSFPDPLAQEYFGMKLGESQQQFTALPETKNSSTTMTNGIFPNFSSTTIPTNFQQMDTSNAAFGQATNQLILLDALNQTLLKNGASQKGMPNLSFNFFNTENEIPAPNGESGKQKPQQCNTRPFHFRGEKQKFSKESSDCLCLEVLKRKELLVENNTSRDLTFSENKKRAWNLVRELLMSRFSGFDMHIENIKSHWRYRKRKVTDAFNECKGIEADVRLREKLSDVDYEIFVELRDSNMLEHCAGSAIDPLQQEQNSSPSGSSEQSATTAVNFSPSASNSPFAPLLFGQAQQHSQQQSTSLGMALQQMLGNLAALKNGDTTMDSNGKSLQLISQMLSENLMALKQPESQQQQPMEMCETIAIEHDNNNNNNNNGQMKFVHTNNTNDSNEQSRKRFKPSVSPHLESNPSNEQQQPVMEALRNGFQAFMNEDIIKAEVHENLEELQRETLMSHKSACDAFVWALNVIVPKAIGFFEANTPKSEGS